MHSSIADLNDVLVAAAAFLLVAALPLTDEIGFVACITFIAWHLLRNRRPLKTA